MKSTFLKSAIAGVACLTLMTGCHAMKHKDGHKCGAKCDGKKAEKNSCAGKKAKKAAPAASTTPNVKTEEKKQ